MTGPILCIRKAGPRDAERLAAMHHASFAPLGAQIWTAADFLALLGTPGVVARLAERLTAGPDQPPTGLIMGRLAPDRPEILSLCVAAEARRGGVAGALVASFASALAGRSGELCLEVAADNAAARAFYEALDFAEIGRRKAYYEPPLAAPVDALILARPFGPPPG